MILSDIEKSIKEKNEKVGTPLKDWDIKINYGIKTGFNEAFIIDGATKDRLIEKSPKSAEIIRPNTNDIQILKRMLHINPMFYKKYKYIFYYHLSTNQ